MTDKTDTEQVDRPLPPQADNLLGEDDPSVCSACGWQVFGKDDKGYFCYNCGQKATPGKDAKVIEFTSPHEEADAETPATIPITKLLGEKPMKRVPKKAAPKNRAENKAPVKKKVGARKSGNKVKKVPVKKNVPDEGTPEFYAQYGKKDGTNTIEGEKRGDIKNFVNGIMEKNYSAMRNGRIANVKSDVELAIAIMKKFDGRNFQPIAQYRGYFNGGRHGYGPDGEAPVEPLRSKAALQKAKAKSK